MPRRRGRTGANAVSAPRPETIKSPPPSQAKNAARMILPISSPIDQRLKSNTLRSALEKTASALANSRANTTRNGKASAIPTPTDMTRPPVRRESGRPSSGNAARSTAPPARMRLATTSPRTIRTSRARRVSDTPANETAAIVTRTTVAGASNSKSMRSVRIAGRNAKRIAAGAIQRSDRSRRASAGRRRHAAASSASDPIPRLIPSATP